MADSTLNQVTLKIRAQRRHKKWRIAVSVLASIVVFVTTYLLILPAITKETKIYCGYENHIHTDACYSCYEENADSATVQPSCSHENCSIVCGLEEHEHTEMCYINCHTVLVSMNYDSPNADAVSDDKSKTDDKSAADKKSNADDEKSKADDISATQINQPKADDKKSVSDKENDSKSQQTADSTSTTDNDESEDKSEDSELKWERHITVRDGEILLKYLEDFATLPNGVEAKDAIWYNAETDEKVSLTSPVVKNLQLYAKYDEIVEKEETTTQTAEKTTKKAETTKAEATTKNNNVIKLDNTFTYKNKEFKVDIDVNGKVELPEKSSKSKSGSDSGVELDVKLADETNQSYKDIASYAEETRNSFDVVAMQMMEYNLLYNGQKLDLSDCDVNVKVTPTDSLLKKLDASLEKDKKSNKNTEFSAAVSAYEMLDDEVKELNSIYPYDEKAQTVLKIQPSSNSFALYSSTTANPHFTVEYKAFIDTLADSGDVALDIIIDTSADANGGKAKLPANGVTPKTKNICIDYLPGSKTHGKIAMNEHFDSLGNMIDSSWTDVFSKEEFEYIKAPNIDYFNKFYGDTNYDLIQVKVSHNGHWHAFVGDLSKLHFTNRVETQTDLTQFSTWIALGGEGKNNTTATSFSDVNDEVYVLIDNTTTIQLACKPTSGTHNNKATFYDYDISDGYIYSSYANSINQVNPQNTSTQVNTTRYYTNTRESGINSDSNYHMGGTRLAFGNANTGVVHANNTWNGKNTLNKANRDGGGYKFCTYGLVSRLDSDGNIVYSDDVSAPYLFDEGYAIGKEVYDNYSLDFSRQGDTYVLTSVNGAGSYADSLNYFNKPTCDKTTYNIWTNNFWPMDSAPSYGTDTHDLKFGSYLYQNNRYRYNNATSGLVFSNSDDGLDHNSYFGMHYAVDFELTKDYIGPLEYTFFGDDDMWVFLDGKLVCDIGGVHSTVGEYVNLWDYLEKGSAGKHTLSFFYTERGASGSSCFMQFTLPSVSSATPEQDTGDLRIEKEVTGLDTEVEFTFDINFTDKDGNYLLDDYAYSRYTADGELIDWDIIVWNGGTFKLRNNEYIIIKYLPDGTKFTITEQPCDGYTTSTLVADGEIVPGGTAKGSIDAGKERLLEVRIINQGGFELPSTGGSGTTHYLLGGVFLTTSALIYGYKLRYKNRKRKNKKV